MMIWAVLRINGIRWTSLDGSLSSEASWNGSVLLNVLLGHDLGHLSVSSPRVVLTSVCEAVLMSAT
jgi:hypothetical protein